MTRKQIDQLIKTHSAQRDFAKDQLDKYYYELEAQNQESKWLNRYIKHKRIVEDLKKEIPDDE
ncbi:hypothetical protein FAES_4031 [Fibrella aestuarina BUZ 2]|uniref:Phage protein n=1 Tax=Fibrella aestuarina BUZ 2 TaxID=1166018 RepID=I0KD28_9BACT|nr:hypothetical protein [Fibrella aestuarina]CCH02031.1 hypothetical protein FAES_4031 [Fibrella aestuarina BUZ 2]